MDWTVVGLILVALVTGYIVGGAIWTERPRLEPMAPGFERFDENALDVPLPDRQTWVTVRDNVVEHNDRGGFFYDIRDPQVDVVATPDRPLVYLFERDDSSQLLVHVYADGEADLAERPDNSAVWGPPLEGVSR
jgi:hypothetical protein